MRPDEWWAHPIRPDTHPRGEELIQCARHSTWRSRFRRMHRGRGHVERRRRAGGPRGHGPGRPRRAPFANPPSDAPTAARPPTESACMGTSIGGLHAFDPLECHCEPKPASPGAGWTFGHLAGHRSWIVRLREEPSRTMDGGFEDPDASLNMARRPRSGCHARFEAFDDHPWAPPEERPHRRSACRWSCSRASARHRSRGREQGQARR
jgi:hypothetical protein